MKKRLRYWWMRDSVGVYWLSCGTYRPVRARVPSDHQDIAVLSTTCESGSLTLAARRVPILKCGEIIEVKAPRLERMR